MVGAGGWIVVGMTAIGAERKRVTLPTDFRSPPENRNSREGYPMARFAPKRTLAVIVAVNPYLIFTTTRLGWDGLTRKGSIWNVT